MANEDKVMPASIRDEMLPDKESSKSIVKEDVKPKKTKKEPATQKKEDAPAPAPKKEPVKPKEKVVPYSRFKEVNEAKKRAEEKLETLEASSAPEEYEVIDEADTEKFSELKAEIKELRDERKFDRIISLHPEINDKLAEFEEFRGTKPDYSVEDQAKLFLDQEGLLGGTRQGLETPTSGPNEVPNTALTPEEIQEIKDKQPRQYEDMIRAGKFDDVDWSK